MNEKCGTEHALGSDDVNKVEGWKMEQLIFAQTIRWILHAHSQNP